MSAIDPPMATTPNAPSPMQQSQSSSSVNSAQSSSSNKGADYVYFERTTAGFSDDAVPRSKAAQLKLEHYYKVAVEAAIERNQRYELASRTAMKRLLTYYRRVELERKLSQDTTMSEERKQRQLQQLGKRESAFLRLRRTKLGLDDFRTVKVIGKGAFGEVRSRVTRVRALRSPGSARLRSVWCRRSTQGRSMP